MKKPLWFALILFMLNFNAVAAWAQSTGTTVSDCSVGPGKAYDPGSTRQPTINTLGQNCIIGSLTANLAAFHPEASLTPITATTGGVSSASFTAGKGVLVQNAGTTNAAYCAPGASASTSSQYIPAGGTALIQTTSETQITCATSTSTTTVNFQTGTGLWAGAGAGSGGGSGGGGAITAAINSYAAGALSAGAFATGAGVDGWDLTQGAKADSVCGTSTGTCSVVALLKYLNTQAVSIATNTGAALPAGSALIGGVKIFDTGGTNQATVKAASTASVAADTSFVMQINPSQPNLTTPLNVGVATSTNGGAATVKGGVGVVNGASNYQTVAASATATVLQTSTGATGDYLSHCVIYPGTTGAGNVQIFDSTNSASNLVINFATGTLSNLAPIPIPVGAVSVNGAWKVTTGSNVTVSCFGKFS